jgi:hypothetical protein
VLIITLTIKNFVHGALVNNLCLFLDDYTCKNNKLSSCNGNHTNVNFQNLDQLECINENTQNICGGNKISDKMQGEIIFPPALDTVNNPNFSIAKNQLCQWEINFNKISTVSIDLSIINVNY